MRRDYLSVELDLKLNSRKVYAFHRRRRRAARQDTLSNKWASEGPLTTLHDVVKLHAVTFTFLTLNSIAPGS